MAVMTVMGSSAWALDQKDGVYQIGSLEDYLAFASLVNTPADKGGNPAANAVLTADIDLGTDVTMIGTQAPDYYQGTFDGQGHSIKMNAYPVEDNCAVFRRLQKTAEVRNLRVDATITTAKKYAAGIAAYTQGAYIHNCYVDLTVNSSMAGDATHAGVVAVAERATFIADCFVKLTINGSQTVNCGGIIGWSGNYTTVQNCLLINETTMSSLGGSGTISRNSANLQMVDLAKYANGERPGGATYGNLATAKWDDAKGVTIITKDDIKKGGACYQLNNDQSKIVWTQAVGQDEYPLPSPFGSGKQVYASAATDCHGHVAAGTDVTYSNTASGAECTKHEIDKFGVCPHCGYYDYSLMPRDEKSHKFLLSSAKDFWLAEGQNRIARGTFYDMQLTGDVTLEADSTFVFNNDNWYGGIFDGQGHALTINFTEAPEGASLFPRLQGTVRNLVMHGSISGSSKNYCSIVQNPQDGTARIENVYSDVNISTTLANDASNGGLVAVASSKITLDNCIYNGTLAGANGTTNCGGLIGWCGDNVYVSNCAFTGKMDGITDDNHSIGRNPSRLVMKNTYYVNAYIKEGGTISGATQVDASTVGSGELAFLLNENVQGREGRFYQTIGTDDAPYTVSLGHEKVYALASSYRCDGMPIGAVTYGNTPSSVTIPAHQHENGFCTVCGKMDMDYLKPDAEGWFELKNGHELAWWSQYAASVDLGAKARLTADIEMDDADNEHYATIGEELAPFYGSLDGQFHRISNLHINRPDQLGVGLISVMNSEPKRSGDDDAARAKDPIFIRDLILDKSCSITGKGYVGLIGMTAPWGGNILVQNLGMEGDVTATAAANAGGVLGCVMSSSCKITIDNSFMSGDIYGVNENGSFSGWLGSYATVSNCYAIGTVEHPDGDKEDTDRYFARYGSAEIRNCFALHGGELKQDINGTSTVVVAKVTEDDVLSGALAYRANGNTSVSPKWYQNLENNLDEHPMPVPTHGVVFKLTETYKSAANVDELTEVISAIKDEASVYCEETMAEQAVKDAYTDAANAMEDMTSIPDAANAYMEVLKKRELAKTSAGKYAAYVAAMTKVQTYLAEHSDFEGEDRALLEDYFENVEGPSENYPLGGYMYITGEMQAPSDSLANEIVRVNAALQAAIKHGYLPGTEVSGLLTNADFLKGQEGWENSESMGVKVYTLEGEKQIAGAEVWSGALDMSQTVEELRPGYYKMEITGAVRPSNDRYGLNYIGTFALNGSTNYFMADIEDPIAIADALDGVNCHLTGSTIDLPIYEDGESVNNESGNDSIGYVMQGQESVATVINGGVRYKNYILGYVGEDGKLTVGIRQDKSGYDSDWIGFGNIRLTYCGDADSEETTAALDDVLSGQMARAKTILEKYVPDALNSAKAPSFPQELRTKLAAIVDEAADATGNEAKIALVKKFSDIFLEIREAKAAYLAMMLTAEAINEAAGRVEGDLTEKEFEAISDALLNAQNGYMDGTYTIEQAKNLEPIKTPEMTPFIPDTVGGVFQIGTRKQMAYFCSYLSLVDRKASAELTADIKNFTAAMMINDFDGTLDGKFHSVEMNIDVKGSDDAAMFKHVNGNVKNLILTGTVSTDRKYAAGLAAHAYDKTRINRVTSSVNIVSSISGDGTHGGIIGVVEKEGAEISNSVFNGSITGELTNSCGGIVGWANAKHKIINCLQIGDIQVAADGGHTWSRNPDNCTVSNSYYLKAYGDAAGTQTTMEKMKSGEICYALNGNSSEDPAWFQTLGTDSVPHVTPGSTVYFYNQEYINERPNIQLNSYASNIKLQSDAEKVVVSYLLNAPAQEGEIRFYNGTELAYTETLATGDLTTGSHSVTISNSNLPAAGTKMTFDVKVKGFGSKDPARVGEIHHTYSPYSMAVMNDPESPAFGNIYVVESYDNKAVYGEGTASTGYISDVKRSALYMFNPLFEVQKAADGTPGWKCGDEEGEPVLAVNSVKDRDYKTVRVSEDGRLFVGRMSGKTNSPIYELNPSNLDEPWTPVFTGTVNKENGITYAGEEEQARMSVSFDVAGKGENLLLMNLGIARSNGDFNYTDYSADIYALGTAKQWTGAPTRNFAPLTGQYTIAPMPVSVLSDHRGGVWYVQYRSNPSALQPALKHYNAQGEEDYSDISTNLNGAGSAISPDGTLIALSQNDRILVFTTDYQVMPNGLINMVPVAAFKHKESAVNSLAFDFAGNLMVGASGSETITRYVVPSQTDNVTVTPASSRCAFKVGEVLTGIEQIATEQGDQKVYNLQGIRLNKAEKGINIINGKKVMVK